MLHVAAGECVTVHFTNRRTMRASFHSGLLTTSANGNTGFGSASSGIDVGFGPEQTVAPGGTRDYRFYADTAKLGATLISDFGGATVAPERGGVATNVDTGPPGMYGAIVVAPAGATFTEPKLRRPVSIGAQVDVHVPGAASYRDFTVLMQDADEAIGQSHMPYPTEVKGITPINYRSPGQPHGRCQRRIRRDQQRRERHPGHADSQGLRRRPGGGARARDAGQRADARVQPRRRVVAARSVHPGPNQMQARGIGPWETLQANIRGGAGGGTTVGDLFYGDLRRPFTEGGLWGLQRVHVERELPDQAARQPRLHRQLGRVHHARRERARDSHHPHDSRRTPGTGRRRQAKQVRRPAKASRCGRGAGARSRSRRPGQVQAPSRLAGRGRTCRPAAVTARPVTASRPADAGARSGPAAMIAFDLDRDGVRRRRPRGLGARCHASARCAWRGGALAAVVAVAGAGRRLLAGAGGAGAVPAPATDPEGAQAITALGRALPLRTSNGRVVEVTVLGVRLRAGDHRLIDVRLRYELRRGATYRMDPAREAQLVDGSGQLLTPTRASDRRPALSRPLLRGTPAAGWVTFVRPTAARVVRVQVTLDGGTARTRASGAPARRRVGAPARRSEPHVRV